MVKVSSALAVMTRVYAVVAMLGGFETLFP